MMPSRHLTALRGRDGFTRSGDRRSSLFAVVELAMSFVEVGTTVKVGDGLSLQDSDDRQFRGEVVQPQVVRDGALLMGSQTYSWFHNEVDSLR
jgi:hypothetical protein